MSDSDSKSTTPNNAKSIALHGTGLLLTTLGAGLTAHLLDIGQAIQNHPKATIGCVAAAGTILYAWASWTYSLHKRDSKWERTKDARAQGRPICDCTTTGEIMTQHHNLTQSVDVYACPVCDHIKIVTPRGINVPITADIAFRPPLPAVARQQWILRSNEQRE